jgi:hypothetical protein
MSSVSAGPLDTTDPVPATADLDSPAGPEAPDDADAPTASVADRGVWAPS